MAGSREYLYIVQESALNTPMVTPVLDTNAIYIRLTEGNAFNMSAAQQFVEIPFGGGLNIPGEQVSDRYALEGALKTKLYPSQAAFLMGWATTRVNSGGTAPWVTTNAVGDLASCSVYHAIQQSDGTYKKRQYGGCKITSCGLEVSTESTVASLNLGIMGSQQFGYAAESTTDPTTLFALLDTHYPYGPYTFTMTSGGLSIASTRTSYSSLNINIQNFIDGAYFENMHRSTLQFCGRKTTLQANLLFKPSPDDRAVYEAITAQAVSAVFTNGVTLQNMTVNMHGKNNITELPYDLPIDKHFETQLKLVNNYDTSIPEDFVVTFA